MNTFRNLLLIATSVFCLWSATAEEGFYVGVSFGTADLEVSQSSFPNANFTISNSNDEVLVADFSGGYRFSNNLTVDFAFEGYDSFDLFNIGDSVDLKTYRVGGGYHFPSKGRLSGFIKAGVSFWDLEFTESPLFNPGAEESASRDGNDLYVQFGADLKIVSGLSTRLMYDISNADFGDTSAVKLWFGWSF